MSERHPTGRHGSETPREAPPGAAPPGETARSDDEVALSAATPAVFELGIVPPDDTAVVSAPAAVAGFAVDEDVPDDADDVPIGVSAPVPTPRVAIDEIVVVDAAVADEPGFRVERNGQAPTAAVNRVGRPPRMFPLWFGVTASVVTVAVGARLSGLGLSLRQVVLATAIGIAVALVPLGIGTLAGKQTGHSAAMLSRATFGVVGNLVPAALLLVVRMVWGALLVALLGRSLSAAAAATAGAPSAAVPSAGPGDAPTLLAGLAVLLVAAVIAGFGYALLRSTQLVLLVVGAALTGLVVVLSAGLVDLRATLAAPDGPPEAVVAGATLVFAFLGLAWASSGADLARYQRTSGSGGATLAWLAAGVCVPALALTGYGAALASSAGGPRSGLTVDPVGTLAGLLPGWPGAALAALAVVSALAALVVTLYSGGLAAAALTAALSRSSGVYLTAVGAAILAQPFGGLSRPDAFLGVPVSLAVPVAAWAGLSCSDAALRGIRFDPRSLMNRGGSYADVRWPNLLALLVLSVLGWGLLPAGDGWSAGQGYLFALVGIDPAGPVAAARPGLVVAFVLGLLVPVAGIRAAVGRNHARASSPVG